MPKEMKQFTAKEIQTLSGYKFPGPAAISMAGAHPAEISQEASSIYCGMMHKALKGGQGKWEPGIGLTITESIEDIAKTRCMNAAMVLKTIKALQRAGWIEAENKGDDTYVIRLGYPKEAK